MCAVRFALALTVAGMVLAAGAFADTANTRAQLRRSVGDLEARVADARAYAREQSNARGAQLEAFRVEMKDVRLPALQRDLDAVRRAVDALRDTEPRHAEGGIQLAVDSCWPKWKRLLAADKYLFRAWVRVDPGSEIRGMAIREPSNDDRDKVRVPPPKPRDDGRPGEQFEIYDSFKIWGSQAEFVVEDAHGAEHVLEFECD